MWQQATISIPCLARLAVLLIWLLLPWAGHSQERSDLRLELPDALFTEVELVEDSDRDIALLQRVYDLINHTPPGEEITVCIFKFGVEPLAEALIAASKKGVKVRVILNDGETSEDTNKDIAKLLDDKLDDFFFIENDISKKGIIHNKFILFSEVATANGPASHVVLQTSSNFQKKGTKKLQDMVIFSSPSLYHGYLDFWYDIKVLGVADQLDHYEYQTSSDDTRGYKAYFFPKIKNQEDHGKDNVLSVLKNIKEPKRAKVRFAHGKWSENRIDIVRELEDLVDNGASVTVITNGDIDKDVRDAFEDLSKNVSYLDKSFNMHTKFFLVDDGDTQTVWTGSHNLTERSLRENFEVLLRIDDPEIYAAYYDYFNMIKTYGTQ